MKAITTYTDKKYIAKQIAKKAIKEKHSVTVHISEVESLYVWKEKAVKEREWKVEIICADENKHNVMETISQNHNYKQPAIFISDIDSDEKTSRWIEEK